MLPILAMIAGRLIYKAISSGVAAAGKAGSDIADAVNTANEQRAWNERARKREEQDRAARARPMSHQSQDRNTHENCISYTSDPPDPVQRAVLSMKSQEAGLRVAERKAGENPTTKNVSEVERWKLIVERGRTKIAIQEEIQAANLSSVQKSDRGNGRDRAGKEAETTKDSSVVSSEETARQAAIKLVEEAKRRIAASD